VDGLDETDIAILETLTVEGRLPNSALAQRVGLAASTCLMRVRALRERGIIRGFSADIDASALGLQIQALVSISMQSHARERLPEFMDEILSMPRVLNVYLLAGPSDFLVHVAARSVVELRQFVIEDISRKPEVASTETSLIFQYAQAPGLPTADGAATRSAT
jgi:DNA-binding Lrp family transcriptional regulator